MPPGATHTPADEALVRSLRAGGHRVTAQRLLVSRALRDRGGHSTAEQIHRDVAGPLGTTSLPTVYAVLNLLVELGLARRVHAGDGPAFYDPRAEPHHHRVCTSCGRIEDVDADVDLAPVLHAAGAGGFTAAATDVVVSGRCAACASRDA
jgi:Fe2+ or Zn2+ uptake regulation protein